MAGLSDIFSGFVQGFDQTKRNMEESKRKQQMDKLQAKLFELSLKDKETQQAAADKIREMTIGKVGEIVTRGQKEIGGRQAPNLEFTGQQPKGLTEILADPEGQIAALEAGFATAKDFAPNGERKFEKLASLEAMGIDPRSEEGKKFLMGGELGTQVDALNAQLKALELQVKAGEFKRSADREGEEATLGAFAVESVAKNAQEAVDIAASLEGTPWATGTSFGGAARDIGGTLAAIGSAGGADTKEAKEHMANRDRLDKLYGQILNTRIERMTQNGQQMTDNKLAQLQKTSPSGDKRPEANNKLLADFLEEELVRADAAGTPILGETRSKIKKFIEAARSATVQDVEAVVDVPAIAKMTVEQLQALVQSGQELSEEARIAAADRWEELKNAAK